MELCSSEKLKIYENELLEIARVLQRERLITDELEYQKGVLKHNQCRIDKYERPEEYYYFNMWDKNICITRKKRHFEKEYNCWFNIKQWRYTIKTVGVNLDRNKITFDGETKTYGDYGTLEDCIPHFVEAIQEVMKEQQKALLL